MDNIQKFKTLYKVTNDGIIERLTFIANHPSLSNFMWYRIEGRPDTEFLDVSKIDNKEFGNEYKKYFYDYKKAINRAIEILQLNKNWINNTIAEYQKKLLE